MRIGFLGGTFSPPHVGHLHSAEKFYNEMNLDKLFIIPAKVSPFKAADECTASDKARLEMARLCFETLCDKGQDVSVLDIEIKKNSTSYTIETIEALEQMYTGCQLFMFVGSDMFLSLEKWKDFKKIFSKCHIYTRCRTSNEQDIMLFAKEKYEKLYNANITLSQDKEVIVSSTQIRNEISTQNMSNLQNLLTEKVLGYIIKNRLYF